MTVINVTAAFVTLGGTVPVRSGRVTIEYLRGLEGQPVARAAAAKVTLPAIISVAIIDGAPETPIDAPPTDGSCYARIRVTSREPYLSTPLELPAVAIPTVGPVDITALPAVDPSTFEPVVTVVTAWQLAVDEITTIRGQVTAAATDAAESSAAAGVFAAATDFDANRAGESAFQSGQSAGYALGHKNAAKGSADAAAASATLAEGSATSAAAAVVAANTERQGAADERIGARQERQDAQTARAGAEAALSGASTARTAAETAQGASEGARDLALQYRDQALAGQMIGAAITSVVDVNTFQTPGRWRFSGAAISSANLPVAKPGVLDVRYITGSTNVQQEYRPFSSVAADRVGFYQREAANSSTNWDAWQAFTPIRTDVTVGRRVFAWDMPNGREQMVFGDTGWRNVTTAILNGWTATSIVMRRVGSLVQIRIERLDPAARTANTVVNLPSGFRGATDRFLVSDAPGGAVTTYRGIAAAGIDVVAPTNAAVLYGGGSFLTNDPWPTELPGVASGTIPSS